MRTVGTEIHRTWKPCIAKAALLGTLACLAVIGVYAQGEPPTGNAQGDGAAPGKGSAAVASDQRPTSVCKDDEKTVRICKEELKPLQPTGWGRFGRGFQYTYGRLEQPRSVLVGSGSTTQIIQAPEHYLNQHSLTFDFSEVFTSPADFASMVKTVYADKLEADPRVAKKSVELDLCGQQEFIVCLAAGPSAWKRALSGFKITASLSERQGVQQGVIVPEGSFSQHYPFGGEIDFDPAQMFITGTNWKAAIDAVAKNPIGPSQLYSQCAMYEKGGDALGDRSIAAGGRGASAQDRGRCVALFARSRIATSKPPSRRDYIVAALIPKFGYKRISNFDFVKSSGILIPAPFPESALNSFTVTWDFKRAIAATKSRLDAADAFRASNQPSPGGNSGIESTSYNVPQSGDDPKLCIIYSGAAGSSINVPSTFSADSCYRFARKMSADRYALACVSSNDVLLGPAMDAAMPPDDKAKPESNSCRW
jgi:hypothetical protein